MQKRPEHKQRSGDEGFPHETSVFSHDNGSIKKEGTIKLLQPHKITTPGNALRYRDRGAPVQLFFLRNFRAIRITSVKISATNPRIPQTLMLS